MGLGVVLALSPSCNAMLVELHDSSKGNRCSLVAPVDLAQDAELNSNILLFHNTKLHW